LKVRLGARRTVRGLDTESGDYHKALAAAARERHRTGELTLVVLNTVEAAPPEDAKSPSAEYRCRVPVARVNEFARDKTVWRLDQVLGKWTRVNPRNSQSRARPASRAGLSA
jgi:hypothetical protein